MFKNPFKAFAKCDLWYMPCGTIADFFAMQRYRYGTMRIAITGTTTRVDKYDYGGFGIASKV